MANPAALLLWGGELRPFLSQNHKESFISEKPEEMLNEVEDIN